jgi:hypothetical protein
MIEKMSAARLVISAQQAMTKAISEGVMVV